MRILLDASGLVLPASLRGGAYRYAVEVLRRLPGILPEGWETALYVNFFRKAHLGRLEEAQERTGIREVRVCRVPLRLVRALGLPAEWTGGPHDLFHGPFDRLPRTRRAARVVTIHDLAFLRAPEGLPREWVEEHHRTVPPSARRAHRIITVSEFSKRDIVERLGVPPERIQVIYHGIPEECVPPVDPEADLRRLRERYGIEPGYILYLGTLQPNKNIEGLCAAYQILRRRGFPGQLVLAGSRGWLHDAMWERIVRLGHDEGVLQTGYVDQEDVPRLYGNCAAFALVSFLEGFGIPVVEAMACGAPVVAADACSLPEVAGDAAWLVDPHDPEAIAAALEAAATPGPEREERIRWGYRHAARFSWDDSAHRHVEAYRRALETRDAEGA